MKLEKALALLNSEREQYLQSFVYTNTGVERAGTLSAWVEFRSNYGCPDVDEQERRALKAVKKYLKQIQTAALNSLGQTYTA